MKYGNVPGTHTPAGAIKRDTHKTKRKRCISINVVVVVAMVAVVVIPEWRWGRRRWPGCQIHGWWAKSASNGAGCLAPRWSVAACCIAEIGPGWASPSALWWFAYARFRKKKTTMTFRVKINEGKTKREWEHVIRSTSSQFASSCSYYSTNLMFLPSTNQFFYSFVFSSTSKRRRYSNETTCSFWHGRYISRLLRKGGKRKSPAAHWHILLDFNYYAPYTSPATAAKQWTRAFSPPPFQRKRREKKKKRSGFTRHKKWTYQLLPLTISPHLLLRFIRNKKVKGEKKWFKTNNVFRGPRNKIRTWLTEWVLFAGTGQWGPCADGRGIRLLAAKGTRSRRRIQSPAQGESPRLIQGQENTKC